MHVRVVLFVFMWVRFNDAARRLSNEDIRDAILSMVNMIRSTDDKLERHEFRERTLGDQVKKILSTIDKRQRLLDPVKGTISRLDERLATVETILLQRDERERIQVQKVYDMVEQIYNSLPQLFETLKNDITSSFPKENEELTTPSKTDLQKFQNEIETKIDNTSTSVKNIEGQLTKIREENKNNFSGNQKFLQQYENKLTEYNKQLGVLPAKCKEVIDAQTDVILKAVKSQNENIKKMQDKVDTSSSLVKGLEEKLSKLETNTKSNQRLNESTSQNLENIKQHINNSQEVLKNYEAKLSEYSNKMNSLPTSYKTENDLQTKLIIKAFESQNGNLQKQITNSKNDMMKNIKTNYDNTEKHMRKLESLPKNEKVLAEMDVYLKGKTKNLEQQLGHIQKQLTNTQDTTNKVKERVEEGIQLQKSLQNCQKRFDTIENNLKQNCEELKVLNRSIAESYKKSVSATQEKCQNIIEVLRKQNIKLEEVQKQLNGFEDVSNKIKGRIEEAGKQQNALEKSINKTVEQCNNNAVQNDYGFKALNQSIIEVLRKQDQTLEEIQNQLNSAKDISNTIKGKIEDTGKQQNVFEKSINKMVETYRNDSEQNGDLFRKYISLTGENYENLIKALTKYGDKITNRTEIAVRKAAQSQSESAFDNLKELKKHLEKIQELQERFIKENISLALAQENDKLNHFGIKIDQLVSRIKENSKIEEVLKLYYETIKKDLQNQVSNAQNSVSSAFVNRNKELQKSIEDTTKRGFENLQHRVQTISTELNSYRPTVKSVINKIQDTLNNLTTYIEEAYRDASKYIVKELKENGENFKNETVLLCMSENDRQTLVLENYINTQKKILQELFTKESAQQNDKLSNLQAILHSLNIKDHVNNITLTLNDVLVTLQRQENELIDYNNKMDALPWKHKAENDKQTEILLEILETQGEYQFKRIKESIDNSTLKNSVVEVLQYTTHSNDLLKDLYTQGELHYNYIIETINHKTNMTKIAQQNSISKTIQEFDLKHALTMKEILKIKNDTAEIEQIESKLTAFEKKLVFVTNTATSNIKDYIDHVSQMHLQEFNNTVDVVSLVNAAGQIILQDIKHVQDSITALDDKYKETSKIGAHTQKELKVIKETNQQFNEKRKNEMHQVLQALHAHDTNTERLTHTCTNNEKQLDKIEKYFNNFENDMFSNLQQLQEKSNNTVEYTERIISILLGNEVYIKLSTTKSVQSTVSPTRKFQLILKLKNKLADYNDKYKSMLKVFEVSVLDGVRSNTHQLDTLLIKCNVDQLQTEVTKAIVKIDSATNTPNKLETMTNELVNMENKFKNISNILLHTITSTSNNHTQQLEYVSKTLQNQNEVIAKIDHTTNALLTIPFTLETIYSQLTIVLKTITTSSNNHDNQFELLSSKCDHTQIQSNLSAALQNQNEFKEKIIHTTDGIRELFKILNNLETINQQALIHYNNTLNNIQTDLLNTSKNRDQQLYSLSKVLKNQNEVENKINNAIEQLSKIPTGLELPQLPNTLKNITIKLTNYDNNFKNILTHCKKMESNLLVAFSNILTDHKRQLEVLSDVCDQNQLQNDIKTALLHQNEVKEKMSNITKKLTQIPNKLQNITNELVNHDNKLNNIETSLLTAILANNRQLQAALQNQNKVIHKVDYGTNAVKQLSKIPYSLENITMQLMTYNDIQNDLFETISSITNNNNLQFSILAAKCDQSKLQSDVNKTLENQNEIKNKIGNASDKVEKLSQMNENLQTDVNKAIYGLGKIVSYNFDNMSNSTKNTEVKLLNAISATAHNHNQQLLLLSSKCDQNQLQIELNNTLQNQNKLEGKIDRITKTLSHLPNTLETITSQLVNYNKTFKDAQVDVLKTISAIAHDHDQNLHLLSTKCDQRQLQNVINMVLQNQNEVKHELKLGKLSQLPNNLENITTQIIYYNTKFKDQTRQLHLISTKCDQSQLQSDIAKAIQNQNEVKEKVDHITKKFSNVSNMLEIMTSQLANSDTCYKDLSKIYTDTQIKLLKTISNNANNHSQQMQSLLVKCDQHQLQSAISTALLQQNKMKEELSKIPNELKQITSQLITYDNFNSVSNDVKDTEANLLKAITATANENNQQLQLLSTKCDIQKVLQNQNEVKQGLSTGFKTITNRLEKLSQLPSTLENITSQLTYYKKEFKEITQNCEGAKESLVKTVGTSFSNQSIQLDLVLKQCDRHHLESDISMALQNQRELATKTDHTANSLKQLLNIPNYLKIIDNHMTNLDEKLNSITDSCTDTKSSLLKAILTSANSINQTALQNQNVIKEKIESSAIKSLETINTQFNNCAKAVTTMFGENSQRLDVLSTKWDQNQLQTDVTKVLQNQNEIKEKIDYATNSLGKNISSGLFSGKEDCINTQKILQALENQTGTIRQLEKHLKNKTQLNDAVKMLKTHFEKFYKNNEVQNDTFKNHVESILGAIENHNTNAGRLQYQIQEKLVSLNNEGFKNMTTLIKNYTNTDLNRNDLEQVKMLANNSYFKMVNFERKYQDKSNELFESMQMIKELTETLNANIALSFESLINEIQNLQKLEDIIVQTGDNIMIDTKRQVQYGINQMSTDISNLIKTQAKDFSAVINFRFDNLESSLMDGESGAIANITANIASDIDQVWRQISIIHQEMASVTEALNKAQTKTETYVNGTTRKIDIVEGKVNQMQNTVSNVEPNLNRLLGGLSLIMQEFNQIKIALGNTMNDIKRNLQGTPINKLKPIGPGPHRISI
ncbi:hypothetical protein FQA39_LY01396 [Lamprigera yunnana]|nr:hypothetical protein FQA39_LY01396 [Lamprigera yunnana]